MSLIIEKILTLHKTEFNSPPELVVSVPCPFYLMGEHSRFFNDKTITMATTLPVYMAVSFRQDLIVRCSFFKQKKKNEFI